MAVRSERTGRPLTFRGFLSKVKTLLPSQEYWEIGIVPSSKREGYTIVCDVSGAVQARASGYRYLIRLVNKKDAKEVAKELWEYIQEEGIEVYI